MRAAVGGDLQVVADDDLFLQANDKIMLGHNGSAANMIFDPVNKLVGLGTSAPTEMLHLYNEDNGGGAFLKIQANHLTNWGEAGLRIETPDNRWHLRMDDDSHNNLDAGAISLRSQTAAKEVMTWEADGRVGIGTTTPQHTLHVWGSARVKDTLYAERVGIGTTTPQQMLHVWGSAKVKDTLYVGAFGSNVLTSANIVDEVGVASTSLRAWTALSTSYAPYLTRQITVPTAGYILAIGVASFSADHGISGTSSASLVISDMPDDANDGLEHVWFLGSTTDAGIYGASVSCQRLFYAAAAGTYTYYMISKRGADNSMTIANRELDLLFLPTAYSSKEMDLTAGSSTGQSLTTVLTSKDLVSSTSGISQQADGNVSALLNQINALTTEIEQLKSRLQLVEEGR